jgi:tetratricopeptide (TPR) repeat protein
VGDRVAGALPAVAARNLDIPDSQLGNFNEIVISVKKVP